VRKVGLEGQKGVAGGEEGLPPCRHTLPSRGKPAQALRDARRWRFWFCCVAVELLDG